MLKNVLPVLALIGFSSATAATPSAAAKALTKTLFDYTGTLPQDCPAVLKEDVAKIDSRTWVLCGTHTSNNFDVFGQRLAGALRSKGGSYEGWEAIYEGQGYSTLAQTKTYQLRVTYRPQTWMYTNLVVIMGLSW